MDLLSGRPFWPIRDGLPTAFPPLTRNASCAVAVIGAGISGALTAALLAEAGVDTIVLDRREASHGSTAGNTGLVLYELDTMLHRLSVRLGRERAERAYRRCRDAVRALGALVRRGGIDCGWARRPSLFVAARPEHVARLRREFAARAAAGLDVEWWSRRQLASMSSLPQAAAIFSPDAAEVDPYRLTYGLLRRAQHLGARIHDRTVVTRWETRRRGVELFTARGGRIRARHLVIAAGYESERFLPRRAGAFHSTYAVVSEPLPAPGLEGWPPERCLIWDTGDPYLYLRITDDRRALIGGYDEPFSGARARDRKLPAKAAALQRRFRQLFPGIPFEPAMAWTGTFAVTADGLPFIGQHPEVPKAWFALGFGGNGITFSMVAAEIIRDAILGRTDPDAALFGFDRNSRDLPVNAPA